MSYQYVDPDDDRPTFQVPKPFGIEWGFDYALVKPEDPRCGFILNPDVKKIHELNFCSRPAVYGFRFRGEDPKDWGVVLGAWCGVCAEHATVVRGWDAASEMWSL